MLKLILAFVVLFVSFIIGTFAFSQIIGTIRTFSSRPILLEILTIIIWFAILLVWFFVVHQWINNFATLYYIATVISIILSWRTGKNGIE